VCVNTMPRRKDITNDLREAIIAALNLGRVIWPFFKQFISPSFYSKEDYSQVENIQDSCQCSQEWTCQ